jgi:hypothetical protein
MKGEAGPEALTGATTGEGGYFEENQSRASNESITEACQMNRMVNVLAAVDESWFAKTERAEFREAFVTANANPASTPDTEVSVDASLEDDMETGGEAASKSQVAWTLPVETRWSILRHHIFVIKEGNEVARLQEIFIQHLVPLEMQDTLEEIFYVGVEINDRFWREVRLH